MSGAETVLDYINATKWPVVVSGVVVWLRAPIKKALGNFKMPDEGSVKIVGVGDMEWRSRLGALAAETDEAVILQPGAALSRLTVDRADETDAREAVSTSQSQESTELRRQSHHSLQSTQLFMTRWSSIERAVLTDPSGAVLAAWRELELHLNLSVIAAAVAHPEIFAGVPATGEISLLTAALNEETAQIVESLRSLRNEVAHAGQSVSSEDALEYAQTVRDVILKLLPATLPG